MLALRRSRRAGSTSGCLGLSSCKPCCFGPSSPQPLRPRPSQPDDLLPHLPKLLPRPLKSPLPRNGPRPPKPGLSLIAACRQEHHMPSDGSSWQSVRQERRTDASCHLQANQVICSWASGQGSCQHEHTCPSANPRLPPSSISAPPPQPGRSNLPNPPLPLGIKSCPLPGPPLPLASPKVGGPRPEAQFCFKMFRWI